MLKLKLLLFSILFLCGCLSNYAQQSFRVIKQEETGDFTIEDPISNSIQGLVVRLYYSYSDNEERLSLKFEQKTKKITKPIVRRIDREDGSMESMVFTWQNVDFFFEDGIVKTTQCRHVAYRDFFSEELEDDKFELDIEDQSLLKKMETVNLRGIKVYDNRINFNLNSIKALETLRVSAGVLSASLQINTGNDISIYIDGKYVSSGNTTSYIDYGTHKVEFKKENHHTITKTININSLSGNTITVNSLEPIVGSLKITSDPAGMTVKVDGEEKGITPLVIKDEIIGNHKVELSKVHYYTETKDVEVKESEESRVNMKMTEYARIKFTTNIYNASVYVDGQYIGSTPTTQDVVAGEHIFKVEGYHHRPNVRTITVSGNTGDQYFRLIRQYQRKNVFYIEPTFQCGSLNAVGGTIGFYAANVNVEGTYLYGLDKTNPIYWITEDPNELYTPYEYTYKPSFAGGKIGYGFIIGTRVRITPQIGAGILMINGSGDYGKSHGRAILGSGGLRLECALAPCLNLVAEPEYSFPLTKSGNYKSISEVESKLGKWKKGFNCRIGLSLFW